MMRNKCPVFVVGCPRSGTTFLYDSLQSSGGFVTYDRESHVFSGLATRVGDLSQLKNREKLISKWLASRYFEPLGVDVEEVKQRILRDCRNAGDFLSFVMEDMALRQRADRWADHTPDHVLYMHQIKSMIPDALFIHMVRDGRDVALSLDKAGFLDSYLWDKRHGVMVCAIYWEWTVEAGVRAGSKLGGDYLQVCYEELIRRPHDTFARIGQFLDHDLDWDRIRRVGIGSVSNPNSSFDTNSVGSSNPVSRWRTAFASRDLARFESLFGPSLRQLGYSLGTPTEQISKSMSWSALRLYYRLYFSSRLLIKTQNLPITKYFVRDR